MPYTEERRRSVCEREKARERETDREKENEEKMVILKAQGNACWEKGYAFL